MKLDKRLWFIVAVFLICGSVFSVTAQDETEEAPAIPESTDMALEVADDTFLMPNDFRGTQGEEGDLQWLEDVGILMAENSDLYNVDAAAIAENAKFDGPPNINWEVKKEDESGNLVTESSDNTNQASNTSNITTPGYYQVHNGGARLVSTDCEGEEGEEGAGGSGSNTGNTGSGDESGEGAEGDAQTVTAQQRVGIQVHDCTSPDIWVAFQEGAGTVDMAKTEEALKEKMLTRMLENLGRPFSVDPDDYMEASYIFVDEGKEDERDRIPWEKSARLSIAGPLFNEKGLAKFETGVLPAHMDPSDYRNTVNIMGGEGKNLNGVFVRRNVPFIFAAMSADNNNKRKTPRPAEARIEYADGTEVEKDGEGYLFRVPNYPREEYQDQPEYFFSAVATDKAGNVTTVRMPLYVMNTQAAFEGGRTR